MSASHRQPRLAEQISGDTPRLRFSEVGECLLVSVGGAPGGSHVASTVARAVRGEAGRLAVVLPDAEIALMPDFLNRMRPWVPSEWESIRLIAATAALPRGGRPSPAQELSELLGVEVVAPDGELVAVPGGSLFVASADDHSSVCWWRFRPGRSPEPAGRRFPGPDWERELESFSDPGIQGVVVEEIPAGLWMHWPGVVHRNDLALAMPISDMTVALLVSRAGDPPMRTVDVRRLIEALPDALHERLSVVPYGDDPVGGARLGAVVSLAANRTLRVRTGLPLYVAGRGNQVVAIGSNGAPTWRPFAREVAWRPHGGGRILSWVAPTSGLLPVGPAQMMLNDHWLVEVVEAGLWIRELDRLGGAAVVRELATDSQYCTVVVGAHGVDQLQPPWRAIRRFLRQLPSDAQRRLRVAVLDGAGSRMAREAAKTSAWALADAPLWILHRDGHLLQWRPNSRRHRPAEPRSKVPADSGPRSGRRRGWSRRSTTRGREDLVRLVGFIEEIRQTAAWDEAGSEPDERTVPPEPVNERDRDRGEPVFAQTSRSSTHDRVPQFAGPPSPLAGAGTDRSATPTSTTASGRAASPMSSPPHVLVPDRVINEEHDHARAAPVRGKEPLPSTHSAGPTGSDSRLRDWWEIQERPGTDAGSSPGEDTWR